MYNYSRAAYCQSINISDWNCQPCIYTQLTHINIINSSLSDTQAYIGFNQKNNQIIISFRGSENFLNWIYNLDYKQTIFSDCQDCYVHSGFYYDYLTLFPKLLQLIQEYDQKYENVQFLITGHSLGAALSSFMALDIVKYLKKTPILYNFGQPRVGNTNFAKYFYNLLPDSKRIVYYRDLVPHEPPIDVIYEYSHFPNEIWFDNDQMEPNNYIECDQFEDKNCSDSLYYYTIYYHSYYYNLYAGCV